VIRAVTLVLASELAYSAHSGTTCKQCLAVGIYPGGVC
jgi:hypothetical protein